MYSVKQWHASRENLGELRYIALAKKRNLGELP